MRDAMVVGFAKDTVRMVIACSVILGIASCDLSGPSGPSGPGWLHADLVSPNGQESAAVFELAGGRDLGAIVLDGGEVFDERDGSTIRIVVIMDSPGQIHLEIRTEDVAKIPSSAVVQVADEENRLRSSLTGYKLSFTKVPDGSAEGDGGAP